MSVSWTYDGLASFPMEMPLACSVLASKDSSLPSPSEYFKKLAVRLNQRTQLTQSNNHSMESRHIENYTNAFVSEESPLTSSDNDQIEFPSAPILDKQPKSSCPTISKLAGSVCKKLMKLGLSLESKYIDYMDKPASDESSRTDLALVLNDNSRAQGIASQVESIIASQGANLEDELSTIEARTNIALKDQTSPANRNGMQVHVSMPSSGGGAGGALPKPLAELLSNGAKKLAGAVKDTIWAEVTKTISGVAMTAAWLSGLGMSFAMLVPETFAFIGLSATTAGPIGVGILALALMATHFNNELWGALKFAPAPKDTLTVRIDDQLVGTAKA